MIINEKHGFAFTHIPKCGGTSLTEYLLGIEGSEVLNPKKGHVHGSIAYMQYYKNLYNFATIRDPFTWYLSMYNHCRRHYDPNRNINPQECFLFGHIKDVSFEEWVLKALQPCDCIGDVDIWTSEFGQTEIKEDIIKQKFRPGWFTLKLIYGISPYYREIFEHFTVDDFYKDELKNYVGVNSLIMLDSIDHNIPTILKHYVDRPVSKHKLPPAIPKKLVGTHNKNIMEEYTEELKDILVEQDKVIFKILFDLEDGVWYGR